MRTYAEVLAVLPEADIVDYLAYPRPQLAIFQDNIPGGVRTVTRVYLDQPAAYRSRLTGYDAKRNRWSPCAAQLTVYKNKAEKLQTT